MAEEEESPVSVLLAALDAPNPHFLPGHDAARVDAAEALIGLGESYGEVGGKFLQDVARGVKLTGGWTLRIRAAKILLAHGWSL